jgi:L-fuconolactonase
MVRACPDTAFILDHLGKPDVKAGLLDPWREHVSALAALSNVMCKLSGLVTEADHQRWTPEHLAPYVSHAVSAFGPERIVFGTDFPHVRRACPYADAAAWLAELPFLDERARAAIGNDNAAELWDLAYDRRRA